MERVFRTSGSDSPAALLIEKRQEGRQEDHREKPVGVAHQLREEDIGILARPPHRLRACGGPWTAGLVQLGVSSFVHYGCTLFTNSGPLSVFVGSPPWAEPLGLSTIYPGLPTPWWAAEDPGSGGKIWPGWEKADGTF